MCATLVPKNSSIYSNFHWLSFINDKSLSSYHFAQHQQNHYTAIINFPNNYIPNSPSKRLTPKHKLPTPPSHFIWFTFVYLKTAVINSQQHRLIREVIRRPKTTRGLPILYETVIAYSYTILYFILLPPPSNSKN